MRLPAAGQVPHHATVPSTQTNSSKHNLFRWMSNVRLRTTPWPPSAKRHMIAPAFGLVLVISTGLLACGTGSPAQQPTPEGTLPTRQAVEPTTTSAVANPPETTRGQDGDAASTGGTSTRQSRSTSASGDSAASAATGGKPEGTSTQKPSGPDVDALTALYQATDGDNWKSNTNWLSDQPISTWHGVSVNDAGRVEALHLTDNQLVGHFPRNWASSKG